MHTDHLSIVASALQAEPRQIPRISRQLGFNGLVFDLAIQQLNLIELSQTGRREFLHLLSSENQQLTGLQLDLGAKGLGPGADVDQQLFRIERAMELATGLHAPVLCIDLGPLPQTVVTEAPQSSISKEQLGALILPEMSAPKPPPASKPPDPAFVAQIRAALAEIANLAERYSVTVAFSSSLSGFAAIAEMLSEVRCHWFGVDLDTSAVLRDEWPADRIFSSLGSQIRHVRARDAVLGSDRRTKPAIIGRGSINWRQMLSLLDEADYRGFITIDPTELSDRRGTAVEGVRVLRDLSR